MLFDDTQEQYKPNTKATRPTVNAVRKCRPMRQNREGENNPFYGKKHSDESKQKQSETQKARWDVIRDKLKTEGKSINESLASIVKREVERFLKEEGYK